MTSESSLVRLEREGKLRRQKPDIGAMNDLLSAARRNFEAAKVVQGKIDEAAFKLYYDGLLQIGRVVMLTAGYRPSGGEQHKTTFEAAGEVLGPDFSEIAPVRGVLRKAAVASFPIALRNSVRNTRNTK